MVRDGDADPAVGSQGDVQFRDLGHAATREVLFFDVNGTLKRQDSPALYGFAPTKRLRDTKLE